VALIALALIPGPTVSYVQALTAPGAASWRSRTVDWFRIHGAAAAINSMENWYYTRRAPTNEAPPSWTLPHPPAGSLEQPPPTAGGPPVLRSATAARLPGEDRWVPGRVDRSGRPVLYTSYLRPDPAHASVVAGVAWIRQPGVIGHLVAGTRQPGGSGWPGQACVPAADVPNLVATFNSGWQMADIHGGFYLAGRTARSLLAGEATVTIDHRGRVDVGQWGRDVGAGPQLVAARQNLQLVVDHGRPVPDLRQNAHGQWGSPGNQFQYTSRSGLGVDGHGDLVYVAGTNLTLDTLAAALADAGAVRGMELDIHNDYTFFAAWVPVPKGPAAPTKLLPTMLRPADRYLVADQRDFFYLTLPARVSSS
jgi:hypothetical protein